MFINTYGKDTKFIPGWQPFFITFHPPSPHVHVRGTGGSCFFVYTFGKGEKGRGRYSGGLDPTVFHTTYYVLFIPHTIRRFSFDITHSWQLTFPMLMFIPPIDDFLVDDHRRFSLCWWSSLMIPIPRLYTLIFVDFHCQFSSPPLTINIITTSITINIAILHPN